MNIALTEIGRLMAAERYLCMGVPRDELGAEGEELRSAIEPMVDVLLQNHGTVQIEDVIDGAVEVAIGHVLENSRFCFSVEEQAKLDRGLQALYPIATAHPGRVVGRIQRAA